MSNSEQHHADGIRENRERRPPVYFSVLFYGLIVWGVIFMAYYLLSGWSSEAEFQQKMKVHQAQGSSATMAKATSAPVLVTPAVSPSTPLPNANELYAEHCAPCHGAEAKGGYGPDLTTPKLEYGKSPTALRESIAAGRNNKMPAFAGKLSAVEIDTLVSYLQQL